MPFELLELFARWPEYRTELGTAAVLMAMAIAAVLVTGDPTSFGVAPYRNEVAIAAQAAGALVLVTLLHATRAREPDSEPVGWVASYAKAVWPLFYAYVGGLLVLGFGAPWLRGQADVGAAILGGLGAAGGLVAAAALVHRVRRPFQ